MGVLLETIELDIDIWRNEERDALTITIVKFDWNVWGAKNKESHKL